MTKGKLIDVSDRIDSIDTFESYSGECYLNENCLLVPYIKLELIDQNVIGNIEDRVNIEFSYLIFDGLKEINWIGENELGKRIVGGKNFAERKKADLTNWIAINRNKEGFEIKAIFEKLLIFVPSDSRTGKEWWTPWETPNFSQNIKTEKVKDFFELKNIPKELTEKILIEPYSNLEFKNGINEQIEFIEENWTK
tara:strand:- start:607 stop:1191 length:585 start_codon:yes stop_codon:yes gene_type:complete